MTDQNTRDNFLLPNGLPPPPVPLGLQEMLKDYPGHIERLQQVLSSVAQEPPSVIPAFERAIWALEGRLGAFIFEAQDELSAAKVSEDAVAITKAEEKVSLMRRACSSNGGMMNLENLWDYFQVSKDALK
jgi:hypothetical protein